MIVNQTNGHNSAEKGADILYKRGLLYATC